MGVAVEKKVNDLENNINEHSIDKDSTLKQNHIQPNTIRHKLEQI